MPHPIALLQDADAAQALRAALQRLQPLDDAAWTDLLALGRLRTVAAGEHLLHAGTVARSVFFVREGLLREYYVDAKGHEYTRRFSGSGDITGSLADLLSSAPADVTIEAWDAARLIEMPWAAVDALSDRHPSLLRLLRRMAEHLYRRKMRREFEMLTLSAGERLARLQRDEPGLDGVVPDYLLASYLGITPVHLSRLRTRHPAGPADAGSRRSPARRTGRS